MLIEADTYFASDVHWQPGEQTGLFGHFLERLAERARAGKPTHLYIVGDLFDYWVERGVETLPGYAAHLGALAAAGDAGVEISVLYGNRDFAAGPGLSKACDAEIVGDRVELMINEQRLLLHHGDLFCTRDWRYQFYRRVIRSRFVLGMLGMLGMKRLVRLVGWMRVKSQAETNRKPRHSMAIVDSRIAAEHAQGFDVVICGHVHHPECRTVVGATPGQMLITLGTWDTKVGWYATAGKNGVALHCFDAGE
ncbi:MAG: hypothetical protein A2341_11545 [Deltaproteobacteria bacterium RIFOXYB12_FULL_58_9]|nr:MAG: hypothetical protein A2341_11545 [Deltaproteobacteria bacterium RIFOXYB12_FULL_58_9]